MRTLLLLRHAKSAWPDGVADHDRPLAPRGRQAAPLIGARLSAQGPKPDLVLVSSARRTQETFALIDAALAGVDHRIEGGIYNASPHQLLELVREAPAEVPTLMLVGHNPGMAEFSVLLTAEGAGNAEALQRLKTNFPTAGLAILTFESDDWAEIGPRTGRLVDFITPRLLGGVDED